MSAQSTVLLSGSGSAWTARKEPKNDTEQKKRIERFSLRKTRGYCFKRIPSFARPQIDLDELVNETYLVWRVYRLVYRNKPQYLSVASASKIACGRIMRQLLYKSKSAAKYKQQLWDRWNTRAVVKDSIACGLEALEGSINPKHEQLLTLLLQGYSKGDCANMLGVSAPRVSAMLRKIGEVYSSPVLGPKARPQRIESTRKVDFTPNGARLYRPAEPMVPLAKSTELERDAMRVAYPQCYGSVVE